MFVDIQSFLSKICFALNLSSGFSLHLTCLHEAPCCLITQYIVEKFNQTSLDWLLVLGLSNNRWALNSALKSCLKNKIIRIHCLQNDNISCDLIRWLWNFLFSITILSHDYFCHKLFAEHNILSGIFIPLTNSCDLPVYDQISLFFYRKNLKSPCFENFRLTGLLCWNEMLKCYVVSLLIYFCK